MVYTAVAVLCSQAMVMQAPDTACLAFSMPFPTEEVCLSQLNDTRQMVHTKNKEVGPERQVEIAHMECIQSKGLRGTSG